MFRIKFFEKFELFIICQILSMKENIVEKRHKNEPTESTSLATGGYTYIIKN